MINALAAEDFIVWMGCLLISCVGLRKKYPLTVIVAFGFSVYSAIRIFQQTFNSLPYDPTVRLFNMTAYSALVSILLTVMAVQFLSIDLWKRIFKTLALTNAFLICGDRLFFLARGIYQHEPWGLLLNASMSGCFSATVFPLFEPKERWLRILILASILATGRSLPIAVFFVGIGALFFAKRRYKLVAIVIPATLVTGFLIKGMAFFETRGRTLIWTKAYHFFHDHLHWALGSGLGGFYVIGPTLLTKDQGAIFIWLHSDWFQILFEEGVVGLVAIVVMYGHGIWRARTTPALFASLLAFAAFGIANMPLRYPLSGLFGAFLIRWALEKNTPEGPSKI